MKRAKGHGIKTEEPDTSKSRSKRRLDKHKDLGLLLDDRVELVQQAFSALKSREIDAMAPDCVRGVSADKLKELCLEELLGISSKRLRAVIDGEHPPSDTESSSHSSAPAFDNISLDSISSDESALDPKPSEKKKKKKGCKRHKKHKSKSRSRHGSEEEQTRTAERAGLTVLELIELQARARAIRAQIHAERERLNIQEPGGTAKLDKHTSDDDEVLIKEEPPEIVELISSGDEKANGDKDIKPKIEKVITSGQDKSIEDESQTVTKRNNLTIIVPKQKTSKKIVLKRNKSVIEVPENTTESNSTDIRKLDTPNTSGILPCAVQDTILNTESSNQTSNKVKIPLKPTKKNKKKKRKKSHASDHDEITLQLSDSEKLDLLEDFEDTHRDNRSASSDSSQESSSSKNLTAIFENRDTNLNANDEVKYELSDTNLQSDLVKPIQHEKIKPIGVKEMSHVESNLEASDTRNESPSAELQNPETKREQVTEEIIDTVPDAVTNTTYIETNKNDNKIDDGVEEIEGENESNKDIQTNKICDAKLGGSLVQTNIELVIVTEENTNKIQDTINDADIEINKSETKMDEGLVLLQHKESQKNTIVNKEEDLAAANTDELQKNVRMDKLITPTPTHEGSHISEENAGNHVDESESIAKGKNKSHKKKKHKKDKKSKKDKKLLKQLL